MGGIFFPKRDAASFDPVFHRIPEWGNPDGFNDGTGDKPECKQSFPDRALRRNRHNAAYLLRLYPVECCLPECHGLTVMILWTIHAIVSFFWLR